MRNIVRRNALTELDLLLLSILEACFAWAQNGEWLRGIRRGLKGFVHCVKHARRCGAWGLTQRNKFRVIAKIRDSNLSLQDMRLDNHRTEHDITNEYHPATYQKLEFTYYFDFHHSCYVNRTFMALVACY